jgi:hypothetical protein
VLSEIMLRLLEKEVRPKVSNHRKEAKKAIVMSRTGERAGVALPGGMGHGMTPWSKA